VLADSGINVQTSQGVGRVRLAGKYFLQYFSDFKKAFAGYAKASWFKCKVDTLFLNDLHLGQGMVQSFKNNDQ
jgi:hypothetical protein